MKNKFDSIENALSIETTTVSKEIVEENKISLDKHSPKKENAETDYEYTRGNLYSLIEKGQQAISDILDVAQQSDSPRAFEVAGQLIKNVADVSEKLIDLQQKMKRLNEDEPTKGPKNVTNALFVGSTSDLQKLLKKSFDSSK
jgi:uncharacterized protein YaaN involved in tellurite resistance